MVSWHSLLFAVLTTLSVSGSIAEAQAWEYRLIEVQDWLTDKDILLTSHLEQELTVDDLPDESQVSPGKRSSFRVCVTLTFVRFRPNPDSLHYLVEKVWVCSDPKKDLDPPFRSQKK